MAGLADSAHSSGSLITPCQSHVRASGKGRVRLVAAQFVEAWEPSAARLSSDLIFPVLAARERSPIQMLQFRNRGVSDGRGSSLCARVGRRTRLRGAECREGHYRNRQTRQATGKGFFRRATSRRRR